MMCYYLNVQFQGQRVNFLFHLRPANQPAATALTVRHKKFSSPYFWLCNNSKQAFWGPSHTDTKLFINTAPIDLTVDERSAHRYIKIVGLILFPYQSMYSGADKSLARLDWKKQLKGRHFSSDAEVIAASETWLDGQPSELFLSGLQKLEFGRCSLFHSWLG